MRTTCVVPDKLFNKYRSRLLPRAIAALVSWLGVRRMWLLTLTWTPCSRVCGFVPVRAYIVAVYVFCLWAHIAHNRWLRVRVQFVSGRGLYEVLPLVARPLGEMGQDCCNTKPTLLPRCRSSHNVFK